jgi:hypothetical protein
VVLGALVAVYGAACVFCIRAADKTIVAILDVLWLLGPAANLVHGSKLLWPFLAETLVFLWTIRLFVRSRPRRRRMWSGAAAFMVWVVSGLFAYAVAW